MREHVRYGHEDDRESLRYSLNTTSNRPRRALRRNHEGSVFFEGPASYSWVGNADLEGDPQIPEGENLVGLRAMGRHDDRPSHPGIGLEPDDSHLIQIAELRRDLQFRIAIRGVERRPHFQVAEEHRRGRPDIDFRSYRTTRFCGRMTFFNVRSRTLMSRGTTR